MKDEGPFIVEWVAYHRAIGFDEIHIAANCSNDNTIELLKTLQDSKSIFFYHNIVPPGVSPQASAARLFNNASIWLPEDWVMWLDADEFLNVKIGDGRLTDLIALLRSESFDVDGMLINWRIFGDNNQNGIPDSFISNDFSLASKAVSKVNREIKTLFKYSDIFTGFGEKSLHRPLVNASVKRAPFLIGGSGKIIAKSQAQSEWLSGEDCAGTNRTEPQNYGWDIAQINHYMVRTKNIFDLKKLRGRGWAANNGALNLSRHTDEFFEEKNLNEIEDKSILRMEEKTRQLEREILSNPEVLKQHQTARRMLQDRINNYEKLIQSLPVNGSIKRKLIGGTGLQNINSYEKES